MGDDLSQPERNSVRAPMPWDDEAPHAGFSTAPAGKLVRPVITGGPFGFEAGVNVMTQRDAPGSLMEHVQRLIRTRRACPEIGWGECKVLDAGGEGVVALAYAWQGSRVVTLHNLADQDAEVRLDLGEGRLIPLLGDDGDRTRRDSAEPVALKGYGYRWFRIDGERR